MGEPQRDATVDEHIGQFPPETRRRLEEIRSIVRSIAPDATETISYGIPTFDLEGAHLVHFAGYSQHIGVYPTPRGIDALEEELQPYRHGKGTLQFPLDQPLPGDLIRRVVEARVDAVRSEARSAAQKGRSRRGSPR
jgi:uncharacterized protein YdhG (YjbR/CyaY superfamily)